MAVTINNYCTTQAPRLLLFLIIFNQLITFYGGRGILPPTRILKNTIFSGKF